jgi:hypothetical protein
LLLHQDIALVQKSIKTMAKLHELGYELLSYPQYSPDLTPSDFYRFADLKRMLAGKKFSTYEEVIAKTEAYFENCMTGLIIVSPSIGTILNFTKKCFLIC